MLLHRTGVLTLDWNAWNVKLSFLYQDATFWHLEELLGLLPDLQAGLVGAEKQIFSVNNAYRRLNDDGIRCPVAKIL